MKEKVRRAAVLAALASVPLVLTACGEEENPDIPEVTKAVTEFSNARDQRACDLLTEEALERIYGGKADCLRRSDEFEAGAVRIERVDVAGERARVKARSLGGDREFSLSLERVLPKGCASQRGNWLIDQVAAGPAR